MISCSPASVVDDPDAPAAFAQQVYTGVLRLGHATPSYDAETEPSEEQPWRHLTDADLQRAAYVMTGDVMQTPPMFSAVKVKGGLRWSAILPAPLACVPSRR